MSFEINFKRAVVNLLNREVVKYRFDLWITQSNRDFTKIAYLKL